MFLRVPAQKTKDMCAEMSAPKRLRAAAQKTRDISAESSAEKTTNSKMPKPMLRRGSWRSTQLSPSLREERRAY